MKIKTTNKKNENKNKKKLAHATNNCKSNKLKCKKTKIVSTTEKTCVSA